VTTRFKKGDVVRMEFPQDARDDRYTGRDFSVMGYRDGQVVVTEEGHRGGGWLFLPESLVLVNEQRVVSAADILRAPRIRKRR
jgi:hypothetical protein